ncbi:MAG: condensation domain-containing protein [Cyanobacteria bacterium J06633_8]
MLETRELTVHEQSMEILNNLAASFHIVTISRIKGLLNEELLRQALDTTQERHPFLNARIVEKSNSFWFESAADKIPLLVVHKQHQQQWEEVVIEELNKKINSEKNLLRVTLITLEAENICYLITVIHHSISDASSCIQLHSELLTYCQNIVEGKAETQVHRLSQLPSIYKLIPKSFQGITGAISNIFYLLNLKLRLSRYQPITIGFENSVPIQSRRCGMVHRKLDSELTRRLVEVCRQNQTTVQAALGAAMLFAVAKNNKFSQTKNNYFSFRSSVNLRGRLQSKISNEHLAAMASAVVSFHAFQVNDNFWDLARDIKHKLEKGLTRGDGFRQLLMFKTIMKSFLKKPYQSAVSAALTNIGRVKIPHNYGQFELEEISFVPAQSAFGGIFAAAVSTFRDKMLLNFMFSQPSISTKTIENLADDMICIISDVCN